MSITRRDYIILDGLQSSGHAYISASEAADALRLQDEALVEIWQTGAGFSAWRLSENGKRMIEEAKAAHVAIIDP